MNTTAGQPLSFLSFDNLWKMRIDHPYSLFVRDGDYLWSCGQCPLDGGGAVLFPDDLLAQAEAVSGFIEQYLGEIGCDASAIGRLVVYYVKMRDGDGAALASLFHQSFGRDILVLPVAIPHFYYDGMLIEVDVFGAEPGRTGQVLIDEATGIRLETVQSGVMTWASMIVSATPTEPDSVKDAMERLMIRAGLAAERLLTDQWFVAFEGDMKSLHAAGSIGLCRNARGAVAVPFDGLALCGELIFARHPVTHAALTISPPSSPEARVEVLFSRSQEHFYVAAMEEAGEAGIVAQTEAIMAALDGLLQTEALSFSRVRKATTYYAAGSSADELHDNMQVRNRYYRKPGPASTGLPVLAFPDASGSIQVALLGSLRA